MTALPGQCSSDAARMLANLVRNRGAEIERTGRLPDDIASALRGSGLLRLLMPRVLGGAGGVWRSALDAIEKVAYADGSTGWSLMIGMVGNMLTGYFERDVALELFSSDSPIYVAGVFEPRGIAGKKNEDDSRFHVSGRWRFATGIHLSNWCCVGAIVRTREGQHVRQFLVPTNAITVHSNWDVVGLSGTGSDDVELDAKEIEHRRSFTFDDTPWPEDSFWRIPFFTVAASLMAAAVLGIAASGLEIVVATGPGLVSGSSGFKKNQCIEVEFATAESKIRAARSFVIECVQEIEASAQRGSPPTERPRALLWLAAIHAVQSCGQALDLLFGSGGASSIRRDSPLQQKWRDVRAAGQHVLIARQRLEAVGRVLLGAAADAKPFL